MKLIVKLDSENAAKLRELQNKPIKIVDGKFLSVYFGECVVEFEIEEIT